MLRTKTQFSIMRARLIGISMAVRAYVEGVKFNRLTLYTRLFIMLNILSRLLGQPEICAACYILGNQEVHM